MHSTDGIKFTPAELKFMAFWFGTPPFQDGVAGLFEHFLPKLSESMTVPEIAEFQCKIENMLEFLPPRAEVLPPLPVAVHGHPKVSPAVMIEQPKPVSEGNA